MDSPKIDTRAWVVDLRDAARKEAGEIDSLKSKLFAHGIGPFELANLLVDRVEALNKLADNLEGLLSQVCEEFDEFINGYHKEEEKPVDLVEKAVEFARMCATGRE